MMRRLGRWLGKTAADIHCGIIAGFERLWYG